MRTAALPIAFMGTGISLFLPTLATAQSVPLTCQVARLFSPDSLEHEGLGSSVAISGDRAIASCVGFVYCDGTTLVYRREGQTWALEAKLSTTGAVSVDMSDDVIVFGAPHEKPAGAIYVYRRSGDVWSLSATLRPSDGGDGDSIGWVVSLQDNLIATGAKHLSCRQVCNSAYVFRYDGTHWTEEAKLIPHDYHSSGYRISLATEGDRIVMGLPNDSAQCYFCGSARVYRRDHGQWVEEAKLFAPNAGDSNLFGWSVAISDERIILGSIGDHSDCPCSSNCNLGAAYIFHRTGTVWSLEARLASAMSTYGGFGESVALETSEPASLSSDLAFVGARVFERMDANWSEFAWLSDANSLVSVSSPVAVDRQYAILGASGAAYVFQVLSLPDLNENGINDACEHDCNANGVPDDLDISGGSSDCDSNGVPDECEPDCNANGQADACDIAAGVSLDCTCDGIPDECEPDCNFNGIADSCDIAEGRSRDCTRNGVPDECETDCNGNGTPDSCDIRSGQSRDCNHNQIPDSCDLLTGTSLDCSGDGVPHECDPDCNENKLPDSCDVFSGTSPDIDSDHIPDECEAWYHCISAPGYFDFGPHRVNVQAEFLAMLISHELRAPDSVYDRIVRDITHLDSTFPILTTVRRITTGMTGIAVKLDLAQPHDGFDALNTYYQGESTAPYWSLPDWRVVTLCDTINAEVLREEYLLLPEVVYVEHGATDGYNYNGDYVDLTVDGDLYIYEFSNGSGDCPSGCWCRQIWQFAVDPLGVATVLDYYPGYCGCGDYEPLPNQGDFDNDGVIDCLDPCPAAEDDGSIDADGDGVGDICDACVLTIPAVSVDAAGCPPDVLGDIDRNGDVANKDLSRIRNCMGGPNGPACGYPEIRVYLDSDWDVDLHDISIFQNCFSGTNVPADANCMP